MNTKTASERLRGLADAMARMGTDLAALGGEVGMVGAAIISGAKAASDLATEVETLETDLAAALARVGLTFAQLREANVTRCKRWHPTFGSPEGDAWSGADWSNAMAGEMGEAANIVKKLRRLETGAAQGPDDPPSDQLRAMLADEIADTVIYADLLAAYYGIDLAAAVRAVVERCEDQHGPENPHSLAGKFIEGGNTERAAILALPQLVAARELLDPAHVESASLGDGAGGGEDG